MLSATLFTLLNLTAQVPVIQPTRLRTVLPSRAIVFAERVPGARNITAQLWISSDPAPETYQTHGWRHLLEHLMARNDGSTDRALESGGGYLRAETYRTATVFTVVAPKDSLTLALDSLKNVSRFPEVTQERIAIEAKVLTQESRFRTPADRMSATLWEKAYQEGGLDPFGNLDTIGGATVEDLRALYRRLFVMPGMVVSVSGDIDLDMATKAAEAALTGRQPEPGEAKPPKGNARPIPYKGPGAARAVAVGSFRAPETVAVLAAALAVANDIPGAFVTYTPSDEKGLVTVGHAEEAAALEAIDRMEPDNLFGRGRTLARRWLAAKMKDPAARGLLLVQARDLRPEIGDENLTTMSTARFAGALARFKKGKALETAQ
ncbi:insulinase family protein [bacterium]|nr:MAG: insulinase family protein [bacterium]